MGARFARGSAFLYYHPVRVHVLRGREEEGGGEIPECEFSSLLLYFDGSRYARHPDGGINARCGGFDFFKDFPSFSKVAFFFLFFSSPMSCTMRALSPPRSLQS